MQLTVRTIRGRIGRISASKQQTRLSAKACRSDEPSRAQHVPGAARQTHAGNCTDGPLVFTHLYAHLAAAIPKFSTAG